MFKWLMKLKCPHFSTFRMFYIGLLNNECKASSKKGGPLHYLFLYFPVFYIMSVY